MSGYASYGFLVIGQRLLQDFRLTLKVLGGQDRARLPEQPR